MVDLSTLKVGDTVVLRNGQSSTVTHITFDPGCESMPYTVLTQTKRAGGELKSQSWRHTTDGKWDPIDTMSGDIVQIIPAAPMPDSQPSVAESGGVKHDSGKPDLSLIPSDVLWEVAEVLTHGAKVYGKYNWTKGFDYTRLQAAVLRHINQWSRGIDKDSDSGKSHLTHALCGLMMLRAMELRGLGTDDRDTTGFKKE